GLHATIQRRLIAPFNHHYHAIDRLLLLLNRPILVGIEQRDVRAFDCSPCRLFLATRWARHHRDRFHVLAAQRTHGRAGHVRSLRTLVFLLFPDADQHQSTKLEFVFSDQVEVRSFAFFAGKLFRVDGGSDESAAKFVELFQETFARLLIFINSNRESLNVELFDGASVGFNLHVSAFSWDEMRIPWFTDSIDCAPLAALVFPVLPFA